jgi:hypothetical protein
MQPILLVSVAPYVGKNVVALGMAERFRADGRRIGYFKPIGPLPVMAEGSVTDEDAWFFQRALKLSEPLDQICPLVLSEETVARHLQGELPNPREAILSAFKAVSKDKDIVLAVSMGRLSCGLSFGYSMDRFVHETKARVIVIARYHWPAETLDGIQQIRDLVPEAFAGVIFNRIPASRAKMIEESVMPFLKARGMDVLGIVPDDTVLNAVPVSEMVEALNGKVLCGQDKLDELAENFSIGAMNADAALRFFQRLPNKAVITGGDRSDIQLAALQTSTRCLILTGDLYPNERILARAEEVGVPVVLVSHDTSAAAEICEKLQGHLSLHSEHKIDRAKELINRCLDWELVYKDLGLK